jgi:thiosulfate/3-mercaptopyruvate sulfurtransferase
MTGQPTADGSGPLAADEGGPLVSAQWLAGHLAEVVILDATVELPSPRADGDYQVASGRQGWLAEHIPGSWHADLITDLTDPSAGYHFAHLPPAALAVAVRRWGVTPGRRVVAYDQAGGLWAARLWWELRAIGLDAVVLDGGLASWKSAGLPTAAGDDAPTWLPDDAPTGLPVAAGSGTGAVEPQAVTGAWASRDDVLAVVSGRSQAALVCALGADAFTGRVPTRYSRRGHIPNSVNLPARGLLGDDGLLLEPAALLGAARPLLPQDGEPIIAYCGGGISAALLALALTVIGIDQVAIYDGSLEEWTADPNLPIEMGAT